MTNKKLISLLDSIMSKANLDAIFLKGLSNISYLTNFEPTVKNRDFGLFYSRETGCVIITPGTSYEDVKSTVQVDKIIQYVEYPSVKYAHSLIVVIQHLLNTHKHLCRIGIEGNQINYLDLKKLGSNNLHFVDIVDILSNLRARKSHTKLIDLQYLANLSENMIQSCLEATKISITEIEIDKLTNEIIANQVLSLNPNVKYEIFTMTTAGAERTILPHTTSSNKEVFEGEHLLYCRQLRIENLRVQCDRMGFSKKITAEERFYYNVVLEALEEAFKIIAPGVEARVVDLKIREVFQKYDMAEYYVHRSGASLGFDMAEPPLLSFENTELLEQGMVLVVQPALYIPNLGGFRCSDTVYVTSEGIINLTKYPRDIESLFY